MFLTTVNIRMITSDISMKCDDNLIFIKKSRAHKTCDFVTKNQSQQNNYINFIIEHVS